MEGKVFSKKGVVRVRGDKYTDNNGREKRRWHEVGVVVGTPHNSRLVIKLHPSAMSEKGQYLSIFWDEGKAPRDKMKEENGDTTTNW